VIGNVRRTVTGWPSRSSPGAADRARGHYHHQSRSCAARWRGSTVQAAADRDHPDRRIGAKSVPTARETGRIERASAHGQVSSSGGL